MRKRVRATRQPSLARRSFAFDGAFKNGDDAIAAVLVAEERNKIKKMFEDIKIKVHSCYVSLKIR